MTRHQRILAELRRLITNEFDSGDLSDETRESRAFWNSHVSDIQDELTSEVWDVHSIVAHRFRHESNCEVTIEFDTRYAGHENEASWQPFENVRHTEALEVYVSQMQ